MFALLVCFKPGEVGQVGAIDTEVRDIDTTVGATNKSKHIGKMILSLRVLGMVKIYTSLPPQVERLFPDLNLLPSGQSEKAPNATKKKKLYLCHSLRRPAE